MSKPKKETRTIYVAIGCVFRTTPLASDKITAADSTHVSNPFQVLLAKRREKQLPEIDNMWELPGGKIETNELPEKAVEREFLEETGYLVRATTPLDRRFTVVRNYENFIQHTHIVCYQCELASEERQETKPDSKIGEVTWFNPNDIDYFNILPGSREFIIDVALRLGIHINPPTEKVTSLAVFQVLGSDTPTKKERRGRKYVVRTQFDPSGDQQYMMITHRSGPIRSGRDEVFEFSDHESMIKAAKVKIQKRFHHGYVLTSWDQDFPLLKWIKEMGYPIQNSDNVQSLGIQTRLPFED